MEDRIIFDLFFDENFHIIIEKEKEDFPEPINEEYSIIELEYNNNEEEHIVELYNDLQEELKCNISNSNDNHLDNHLDNHSNLENNNLNILINEDITTGEELLELFQSSLSNIDNRSIIQQIDIERERNSEQDSNNNKMNSNELKSIITEKYNDKKRNETKCSICYSLYDSEDKIRILTCSHFFHKKCS